MSLPFQPGSETSLEAAENARGRAATARARVLEAIRAAGDYGCTDEDLVDLLKMNPSTVRPRRIELVDRKLVQSSGRTRTTRSSGGRCRATVWVAVALGDQLKMF